MTDTLLRLLDRGVTQFHVVHECEEILVENGCKKLDMGSVWSLAAGGRYYVTPYPSMLVTFSVPESVRIERMNIGLAHTDFPMLKLKSRPDMSREGYMTLNVEPYGGLLKDTWFDRSLGIAGKVMLETGDAFAPKMVLYKSGRALCVVPSLAPHLRKNDAGTPMDVQKELIPVCGMNGSPKEKEDIISLVAQELGVPEDDILDYDLYLYNTDKPDFAGVRGDMISSPRIDNVSSVAALISAMSSTETGSGAANINIIALFDNEEIGSRSKQGADSVLLSDIVKRVLESAAPEEDRYRLMQNAFMLSLDVAHACHPNYPEKSDPTNKIIMGEGVALKTSAGQRYVSDSEAAAVIVSLARRHGIRVQRQVNRSGMPGGQTLGPIASSYLPVRAVDMGMPILAMHSARELACVRDYEELLRLCLVLFG